MNDPQPHFFTLDAEDPVLGAGDPDCLVVMGRELARHLINHPEPYTRIVCNQEVLIVNDSEYDILFYLFSGKTRTQLFQERGQIGVLNLQHLHKTYFILNERLYYEAAKGGLTP